MMDWNQNNATLLKHIEKFCQTASCKLHALRRIRKDLTLEKARVLGNAFVDSQFNYAPLIWMFCKKTISKCRKFTIKHLRIIYMSDESYENLLNLDISVSLHQRHLRFLVTEISFYCHLQNLQCTERIQCTHLELPSLFCSIQCLIIWISKTLGL